MPADESSGPDITALIAGGFAVFTTTATAVGGLTGGVARLVGNHETYVWFIVAFTLAAIGSAVWASQLPTKKPPAGLDDEEKKEAAWKARRRAGIQKVWLTVLSFVLFGSAVVTTVSGLAESVTVTDRPRIAGTWKQYGSGDETISVLTVSIKLSGMRTANTLFVQVFPGAAIREGETAGVVSDVPVYQSQPGAGVDGDADLTFDVPVPTGWAALQVVASLDRPVTCEGRTPSHQSLACSHALAKDVALG